MKSLVIAPFTPYPLIFGGAIRLYHLLKMLSAISDVTLVAYKTWSEDGKSAQHLEQFCKKVILIEGHPIHSNKRKKVVLQLRSLFSLKTFQYYSHYSKDFQNVLSEITRQENFDYIVTDFSQMGYFHHNQPQALNILDLHNIEYELIFRRSKVETQILKKLALTLEAYKFRREELAIIKKYDLIFVPSEREKEILKKDFNFDRVENLPNSVDLDYFPFQEKLASENEIVFVGSTQVDANRDGLCYFMEEIFPLIERQVPDVHFSIVGGQPPPEIRKYNQKNNVEVVGFVKDVRPYMSKAKALIVPLRTGGGTRLKILEGLSYGIPTISTPLGAEGINVSNNVDILLASTPQEFALKVEQVLQNTDLQTYLRSNGRKLVELEYSWQAVGKQLRSYL